MIRITSDGGWIGPLCWSNTMPAVIIPDHRFAGITSRLEFWGRVYWCPPGEPWTGLHYSVTESPVMVNIDSDSVLNVIVILAFLYYSRKSR